MFSDVQQLVAAGGSVNQSNDDGVSLVRAPCPVPEPGRKAPVLSPSLGGRPWSCPRAWEEGLGPVPEPGRKALVLSPSLGGRPWSCPRAWEEGPGPVPEPGRKAR